MSTKLRLITDTIHKTVYLSEMESSLMSTAYFYRLHDVYQSSTVYLTFPCNRTKRYEHSCGTMELAGEMFYSAVTNASSNDINVFFQELEFHFQNIVKSLLSGQSHPTYCEAIGILGQCFPRVNRQNLDAKCKEIISALFHSCQQINDAALDHYMPPFSSEISKRKFLYQCALEAVRIVALFHDVGHPPYSHIMEKTLNDLYSLCISASGNNKTNRVKDLISNLQPFKSDTDEVNCLLSAPIQSKAALHERIGLKMLIGAFKDYLDTELTKVASKANINDKSELAIYNITVAEFCFAILREQAPIFLSLHRIIDGCIDADRMDYIVRDALNSGVEWDKIPYKRLIDSCKLFVRDYNGKKYFSVAFPQKMTDHIDDLLLTRYKIFSRINYHHRSYKTALILQKIVETLAKDYLFKENTKKALCPEIADLWNCLAETINSKDLYIIQWNDSTLISHLYHTLAEIKGYNPEDYGISQKEFNNINILLEEFLLNRKHFYSVFKRQSDFIPLFDKAFQKIYPVVEKVLNYEKRKLETCSDNKVRISATESIKRLNYIRLAGISKMGDAEAINYLFPSSFPLERIISDVLKDYHGRNKIGVFLFDKNINRIKTGLPTREDLSDSIFFYDSEDSPIAYNTSALEDQLVKLQRNCLEYIAYIEIEESQIRVIDEIRLTISDEIYKILKKFMLENFSCLKDDDFLA